MARFRASGWALSIALGSGLLPACVGGDAGVGEARSAVSARAGLDLRDKGGDAEVIEQAKKQILSKPLTAESAAKLAVLQNPDVQVALQEIGVARGGLVEALSLPNPELDGTVRFHADSNESVKLDLGASIALTEFIFMPLRGAAASDALDAAALEAAGVALDVGFEAKCSFYVFLAAQLYNLSRIRGTALSPRNRPSNE